MQSKNIERKPRADDGPMEIEDKAAMTPFHIDSCVIHMEDNLFEDIDITLDQTNEGETIHNEGNDMKSKCQHKPLKVTRSRNRLESRHWRSKWHGIIAILILILAL